MESYFCLLYTSLESSPLLLWRDIFELLAQCLHFVGAILLATSVIEQTLSEELEDVAPEQERRTFERMIKSARQHLSLPSDLLDGTDRVRELRNPFTHRKANGHPHSFLSLIHI